MGQYLQGYCGGTADRQCCTQNGPITDKPPMTEPHGTETMGSTLVPLTTTFNTKTQRTTATNQPTKVPIDNGGSSGGLSAGAIVGIVFAVLIVVAVAGIGVYYYTAGSMPAMPKMPSMPGMPSFSKKSTAGHENGFDNPVVFMNDEVEVGSKGQTSA